MGKRKRKQKSTGSRAYEAAISTPSRRPPVGAAHSQDSAYARAYPRINHWGRYLDENSDIASGMLDEWVKGSIGAGLVTIPKPLREDGSIDQTLGAQLIRRWRKWIRHADVTHELHWHQAQRLSCRAWPRDGEHFIQLVAGRESGYPFEPTDTPFRVELLESEMCPADYQDNGYRQGIFHNAWNRPQSYAIYKRHPGDAGLAGMPSPFVSFDDLKFAPARRMLHLKHADRWPATRGVSALVRVIPRLYDIKDLEDSERTKNRILASWTAAIERGPDYQGVDDDNKQGQRFLAMAGGSIIDTLLPGESITGVGPDYPGPNMPAHIADQFKRLASGTSLRYSSISRNYDGTYAAQRQEMVEAEGYNDIREDQFVQSLVRPVYEAWALTELLVGEVVLPAGMDLERAVNAEYRGPAIPWIDPLKEVQADAMAVEKGFVSLDQIRIKRGAPEEMIGQPAPAQPTAPAPARQPPRLVDEDEEEEAA